MRSLIVPLSIVTGSPEEGVNAAKSFGESAYCSKSINREIVSPHRSLITNELQINCFRSFSAWNIEFKKLTEQTCEKK